YSLSSEEHRPNELVRFAQRAEQAGFSFALISDHFHPWTTRQGQSPFVWSVIGGIAATTTKLRLGTGATCPIIRIHPAIIAEAAWSIADVLMTAGDEAMVIKQFKAGGGKRKPKYAQISVCWAKTEKDDRRLAHEWWPTAAFPWTLLSELAIPQYFEEAAKP